MNARAHHTPVTDASVAVGTCLCGTVHYAVDRPLETLSHYSDPPAQAQPGTDIDTFVSAPLVAFRWLAGEEWLTIYDSEEGTRRSFCRWCGSSMPIALRDRPAMLLPLASLGMPLPAVVEPHPMPA